MNLGRVGPEDGPVDVGMVLTASIAIQVVAAILALRLMWVTGKRWAWGMISTAIVLMTARRALALAELILHSPSKSPDLGIEVVGLIISIFMVLGIASIAPLFAAAAQSETALRESQRKFTALMSNLPGMAYRCRNDRDWTMEVVSDGCLALTGYEAADLVGNRVAAYNDLILPEHRQTVWEQVQRALAAREPFRMVYGIRTAAGDEKWVWEQGCGVFDEAGRVIAVEGFITDITERRQAEEILHQAREELEKRVQERTAELTRANERLTREIAEREEAEAALAESEQRFRSLVEATSDWIWETDAQGAYVYSSPKVSDLLGYAAEEVLGRRPFDFMPSGEAGPAEESFRKAAEAGAPLVRLERTTLRKDGRRVILETSGVPVFDGRGRLRGYRGVDRDITKPKQDEIALKQTLAQLEQSNRDLTQFAYSASHDLQEPLRMMGSYLQALEGKLRGKLDPQAQAFINLSLDASRRMQRLINDLLAYSRVGTRGQEFATLDANQVVDQAVANLQAAIEATGATVTRDPLPKVTADATLLMLVFQNLVANGVKFHRNGQAPLVHVACEDAGDEWRFSVRDNGIGIEPDYLDRIFVIFERLHPQDKYPGTGIGLAICKRAVERHGGRIWCRSEPGEGSTFYFTLPKGPTT